MVLVMGKSLNGVSLNFSIHVFVFLGGQKVGPKRMLWL